MEKNQKPDMGELRPTGKKQKINPGQPLAKQTSDYDYTEYKAKPDNNIFFEERSNPLSSKGN